MAEEAENLVLSLLREMRADIKDVRKNLSRIDETLHAVRLTVAGHDLRFDALDEKIDMIREGTVSAIGFAANASRAHVDLHKQIADLARRVDKLEAAK
jgi:hypothetical protein